MSAVVLVLAVLFVGYALFRVFGSRIKFGSRARSSNVKPSYLLLWRLARWELSSCVVSDLGIDAGGTVYPLSAAQAVELPGLTLYLVAIEPLALMMHQALERARASIVIGTLFKPGSDIYRVLQFAALIVPIVVAILFYFRVGDLQGQITRLQADIVVMKEILSKPLSVNLPK